ncbi:XRE family transcriptional regulator [Microbacterium sp. NPDC089189]|uniref:helix-turn-helix domain-containing protein n=1 Tax=Microbacterium sp. NPDC089189 TaxID=3154972 RepID=UPI0034474585
MHDLEQVGPRLRSARRARGWTLDDLASRAQVSSSTLSRLESGKRQASLELLLPLTRELGIRIDDLLQPEDRDPRVRRPVIHRDGHVIAPLAPEGSATNAFKITYPAGGPVPEPRVHDGFAWFYVLSGRLRLILGDQDLVLGRGEAAEFDTRTPHAMMAAGGQPVQVISIFHGDGDRIHTHTEAG